MSTVTEFDTDAIAWLNLSLLIPAYLSPSSFGQFSPGVLSYVAILIRDAYHGIVLNTDQFAEVVVRPSEAVNNYIHLRSFSMDNMISKLSMSSRAYSTRRKVISD